ncbi:Ni/Fe hydrogenase subunit alpha [Desulfopila inferna]|uniref:Ni/Fe hydrogenase subunit alpha n=1 Tax=Desulfopila inferna TaxID=468528 RepID=UPI0019625F7D|nr:Ni/Fe hydrogenase subunit alpha [Desulfopila inferna]MBM9604690.1 Ni/Fe hydrogenase subunit alpha [Desulfopila inferna]
MKININPLTRVEGHATLDISGNRVRFAVTEAPRFFEALVRNRGYQEVSHIASRVCGICAISHACAALKATEKAFAIQVSPRTQLLRRLACYGEIISSHALHLYFLAGPDFFKAASIFELAKADPEIMRRGNRLKELGYALCDTVAGRHTHPVAMRLNGFTFVHNEDDFTALRDRLENGLVDLHKTVSLFSGRIPQMERETEYVSLRHPHHYAFYEGDLYSSEGKTVPVEQYRQQIREEVVSYSTAKYARWHKESYMVGALARFNNNSDQLSPGAQEAAVQLGLKTPCFNPFSNTTAQIVEMIHCVEDSIDLIDQFLSTDYPADADIPAVTPISGRGVGAVEAPRGILFHEYEYNDKGKCTSANMVIPTAQNLANLEADLNALLPSLAGLDKESTGRQLEMLARAYDPCISCSSH